MAWTFETPLHLSVFICSPGDVTKERRIALEVLERLPRRPAFANRVTITPVAWDDPEAPVPLTAGRSPQDDVNRFKIRPSHCDVTIVILWGRLGTRLPPDVKKPDGGFYASGTEWEYEDARRAKREILVYHRTEPAPDRTQADDVRAFLARFTNPDGSLGGGCNEYAGSADFGPLLDKHLETLVRERLDTRQSRARWRLWSLLLGVVLSFAVAGALYVRRNDRSLALTRAQEAQAHIGDLMTRMQYRKMIDYAASIRAEEPLRLPGLAYSVQEFADWMEMTSRNALQDLDGAIASAQRFKSAYPESSLRPQIEQLLATWTGLQQQRRRAGEEVGSDVARIKAELEASRRTGTPRERELREASAAFHICSTLLSHYQYEDAYRECSAVAGEHGGSPAPDVQDYVFQATAMKARAAAGQGKFDEARGIVADLARKHPTSSMEALTTEVAGWPRE